MRLFPHLIPQRAIRRSLFLYTRPAAGYTRNGPRLVKLRLPVTENLHAFGHDAYFCHAARRMYKGSAPSLQCPELVTYVLDPSQNVHYYVRE